MGLHLENEVVKTPTIISNDPIFMKNQNVLVVITMTSNIVYNTHGQEKRESDRESKSDVWLTVRRNSVWIRK